MRGFASLFFFSFLFFRGKKRRFKKNGGRETRRESVLLVRVNERLVFCSVRAFGTFPGLSLLRIRPSGFTTPRMQNRQNV